jgi:3-hydroxyacyl-[acyl-carrier-protein] dehydratase
MKFRQIDRIVELIPGERIVATRTLRAEEDYLRDHFPLFPVMPGVLMLEALYQASCFLIRETEDFQCVMLPMLEVRNVKFADFVEPGDTIEIRAEIIKNEGDRVTIKASGTKGDSTTVSARLIIGKSQLSSDRPELAPLDRFIASYPKKDLEMLISAGKSPGTDS